MKFLSQARKFLQNLGAEPQSRVQYFNVICASGHRVRGERTEGYQALRCPACGDGVFVLPRSPLPEPVAPSHPQSAKAAGSAGGWIPEGPVELSDAPEGSVDVGDDDAVSNGAEIIWEDVADEYMPAPPSPGRHSEEDAGETAEDRSASPAKKSAAHARGGRAPDATVPGRSRPKEGEEPGHPVGGARARLRATPSHEAREGPRERVVRSILERRNRFRSWSSNDGPCRGGA